MDNNMVVSLRNMPQNQGRKNKDCPHCPRSFCNTTELNLHVDKRHLGKKVKHKCDECPKSYGDEKALKRHKKQAHRNDASKLTFVCPVCRGTEKGSISSRTDNLRNRHIKHCPMLFGRESQTRDFTGREVKTEAELEFLQRSFEAKVQSMGAEAAARSNIDSDFLAAKDSAATPTPTTGLVDDLELDTDIQYDVPTGYAPVSTLEAVPEVNGLAIDPQLLESAFKAIHSQPLALAGFLENEYLQQQQQQNIVLNHEDVRADAGGVAGLEEHDDQMIPVSGLRSVSLPGEQAMPVFTPTFTFTPLDHELVPQQFHYQPLLPSAIAQQSMNAFRPGTDCSMTLTQPGFGRSFFT